MKMRINLLMNDKEFEEVKDIFFNLFKCNKD